MNQDAGYEPVGRLPRCQRQRGGEAIFVVQHGADQYHLVVQQGQARDVAGLVPGDQVAPGDGAESTARSIVNQAGPGAGAPEHGSHALGERLAPTLRLAVCTGVLAHHTVGIRTK